MVAADTEITSPREVESSHQPRESKHDTVRSIGRQLSLYSLTLDEFQSTLCESGRSFGSMNMDEFLNSIWTAEENLAQSRVQVGAIDGGNSAYGLQFLSRESSTPNRGIYDQSGLAGQGSLSVPETVCRKTVDEVWTEIHKAQQGNSAGQGNLHNIPNATTKQPTFGEMTLEDFLVRAGVVRAHNFTPHQQQSCGMYQNNNPLAAGPNFAARPVMPASAYSQQPSAVGYGGRMGNGSRGVGQVQGLGMGTPASPVSSDGLCKNQVDGLDADVTRGGRGRNTGAVVEKVVERRQRRMIKNRESAARSRARKQAYTVELEAELNQLKEENTHLKQALVEFERKRKQQQQYYDEVRAKRLKQERGREKVMVMRRSSSCIY